MVTVSRNGHSVMQWSQRHVNRDPVNTMGHHSWDQRPQCHAMVTLSRESWFTEHDGTSQLGSGVRVSLESWSIEHDETSQLGSGVRVSLESLSIEHDETSQLGSGVTRIMVHRTQRDNMRSEQIHSVTRFQCSKD